MRLGFNALNHIACVAVQSFVNVIKTNSSCNISGNLLEVNLFSSDADFSKQHNKLGFGSSLHSDLGIWVESQTSIEDTIRDLVAHLIWVTFTNRFRSEENVIIEN